jgi:hypothetical protein
MRQVTASLVLLVSFQFLVSCQRNSPLPADFRPRTLDLKTDVQHADVIVLAIPVSWKVAASFLVRQPGKDPPTPLTETETTLDVLQVLKGPLLPGKLRFRHFGAQGDILVGPPQGPSGLIGSPGLFFLRQGGSGRFRSIVDVFRPDISTPWIGKAIDEKPCSNAAVCVSQLLLTYHEGDDATAFASRLAVGVADTMYLRGFFPTLKLLEGLVDGSAPPNVKRAACREFLGWYPLELPHACKSVVLESLTASTYAARVEGLRKDLRNGGMEWLQRRAGTSSESELRQYQGYLLRSADEETREIVRQLR